MNSTLLSASVFFGTILASYVLVALFKTWMERRDVIDIPNGRSSHIVPVPKGGGIAIVGLTLLGFLVFEVMLIRQFSVREGMTFIGAAGLIAAVSWVDDLRDLSSKVRFSAHAAAAIFSIIAFGYFEVIRLPVVGIVSIGLIGIPITFLWIVGLTNIYNFMDGIDGIAGTQAIMASTSWFLVSVMTGQTTLAFLAILVAGTSAGFLIHNWHPASIFMGDVGSAFLGYTFALMPLLYFGQTSSPDALLVGVFTLSLFIFDGTFTILRRLRNGENIFEAHRSHLYQRLNVLGQSHDQVATLYLFLASIGMIASVLMFLIPGRVTFFVTVSLLIVCVGLWYYVQLEEQKRGISSIRNSEGNLNTTTYSIWDYFAKWTGALSQKKYFIFLDIVCLSIIPYFSIILRLDTAVLRQELLASVLVYTIVAMVIRLAVFYAFNLYRPFWQNASVDELAQIVTVVTLATALVTLVYLSVRVVVTEELNIPLPRTWPIIDGILTLLAIGGSRYVMRFLIHRHSMISPIDGQNALVVGAGSAGAMIVRQIQRNPGWGIQVVGFLDDDLEKHNMSIHGIPVIGGHEDIARLAVSRKIEQLIVAIPSASGELLREITQAGESVGVATRVIPSIREFLDGTPRFVQLRDIAIEDLLRRPPVTIDEEAVENLVGGKRVLVTGAGGSIGSELCRQIWRHSPKHLILLGHGENSIFSIQSELTRLGDPTTGKLVSAVLADVRFPERLDTIFESYQPDIVFHAAAHKHVPLMEHNPVEAITNNVHGTQNVLNAALKADVARFVMVSTDKAVNPTSIMGASKRIAEMAVHRAAKVSGKPYVAVRFGNVLGSRGSVVWSFKSQIASGGPVTVTHPDIERYFMTIPEAVRLILQAAVMGKGQEVFVLDMGTPIKIVDLAKDMIKLAGLREGIDVLIKFVGLRPGEKLFEELFIKGEDYKRTENAKMFSADNASALAPDNLDDLLDGLNSAVSRNDKQLIMLAIKRILPEFSPPEWEKDSSNSSVQEVRSADIKKPRLSGSLS